METLTPQNIRDRAYGARVSINQLLARADVNNSTFWRWAKGKTLNLHPVTAGKISDALSDIEQERAV